MLGGHISRIHKGESTTFQRRLKKREERTTERLRFKFLKRDAQKKLNEVMD